MLCQISRQQKMVDRVSSTEEEKGGRAMKYCQCRHNFVRKLDIHNIRRLSRMTADFFSAVGNAAPEVPRVKTIESSFCTHVLFSSIILLKNTI